MGAVEVFPQFGDGNVEVEVTALMKDTGDEVNDKAVSSILIWGQLDFHRPKLDSPADIIVNGYFESDRIPVGTIKHFKEGVLVIGHFGEVLVDN